MGERALSQRAAGYIVTTLPAAPDAARGALCPILVVGDPRHPNAAFCDVIVPDRRALDPIIANIGRTPIAAMTLVQVLRATEKLDLMAALTVESLAYGTLQGGTENRAWLATRGPIHPPPADQDPAVLLDRQADHLTIHLNRPAAFNALNMAMRDALAEGLTLAALDDTIRQVHLHGTGRCFSVGGALEEFGTAPDQATAHAVRCATGPAFLLAPLAARATAHVHGACIGAGAELAGLCGRVVARPNAFFQLPEIRFGLLPGSGGTVGIARRIGRHRTAYLALSGRRIGARRALQWGLVDAITPYAG